MEVNREQFLDILTKLKPGLASRDVVEANTCFRFHPNSVISFNEDAFVSVPFESEFEGGVKANELFQLVAQGSSPHMQISIEGKEFRMLCGNTKAGISLVDADHPPITLPSEWSPFTQELKEAIKDAEFAAGDDMTNIKHTLVHVQGDTVTASDGFKLSFIALSEPSPFNFLFPKHLVKPMLSYNPTQIYVDDDWMHTRNDDNVTFSARKVYGIFFAVDELLKFVQLENEHLIVFPEEITQTIDRCLIMTDQTIENATYVNLLFAPTTLVCFAQKALGWVKETLPIEFDGPTFTLCINPKSLQKFLGRNPKVTVGSDKHGNYRCLFVGDNFKHLIACRRQDPPSQDDVTKE